MDVQYNEINNDKLYLRNNGINLLLHGSWCRFYSLILDKDFWFKIMCNI